MGYVHASDPSGLQKFIDESSSPIFVQFSADWCGPCRAMAPQLEAYAQSRANQLPVIKIDIDEYPDVAARFMVRSVPTSMVLENGRVLGVHSGALSAHHLERFVEESVVGHRS